MSVSRLSDRFVMNTNVVEDRTSLTNVVAAENASRHTGDALTNQLPDVLRPTIQPIRKPMPPATVV